MTDLRTAAQQALEALEWHYRQGHSNTLGGLRLKIDEKALRNLKAALAQQAEPVHARHGACPTHCCPVHGCKYMHDDCPVASGAVQPVYPRNNGCESCADDALAQQAEPVDGACLHGVDDGACKECYAANAEPVAWGCNRCIEDDNGFQIGTDDPELAWGRFAPDDNGWWPLYTTPPQRTMVPLTEEEIEHIGMTHQSLRQVVRAVEKASWEKNHAKGL